MQGLRRITTIDEFLPYTALSIYAPRTGGRPGSVPDVYYVYSRNEEPITADPVTQVQFQSGPFRDGANGITTESAMAILLDRMQLFQLGPLSCRENALAITKMEESLMWMRIRIDRKIAKNPKFLEGIRSQSWNE